MYYVAKIAQAAGLAITAVGFVAAFPKLVDMRIFSVGVLFFLFGWIVEQYLLRK